MDRQKIANISIIQEALVPQKPVYPTKRVNYAAGGLLGTALGIAIAFFIEFLLVPVRQKSDEPAV